jgi:hypothetical protein
MSFAVCAISSCHILFAHFLYVKNTRPIKASLSGFCGETPDGSQAYHPAKTVKLSLPLPRVYCSVVIFMNFLYNAEKKYLDASSFVMELFC